MCFLPQKKESLEKITQSGMLSPGLIKTIESLITIHGVYSEIAIRDAYGNYNIGRLMLDPFSNLLYSTQPNDYTKIKELTTKGLSVSEAIHTLMRKEIQ